MRKQKIRQIKEITGEIKWKNKVAVISTSTVPNVEGAIVVAKGAKGADMKSKIASAVATCVGIPVYKVQVFEKE